MRQVNIGNARIKSSQLGIVTECVIIGSYCVLRLGFAAAGDERLETSD